MKSCDITDPSQRQRGLNNRLLFIILLSVLALAAHAWAGDAMMPDPKLTPGKTAATNRDRQGVTEAMEREVFARYGIPWTRRVEFKVDHLIPVELGGADSVDNLWPQSLKVRPYDARRKELLTRRLVVLVGAHEITLAQAQQEIREDWISSFIARFGMVYLK